MGEHYPEDGPTTRHYRYPTDFALTSNMLQDMNHWLLVWPAKSLSRLLQKTGTSHWSCHGNEGFTLTILLLSWKSNLMTWRKAMLTTNGSSTNSQRHFGHNVVLKRSLVCPAVSYKLQNSFKSQAIRVESLQNHRKSRVLCFFPHISQYRSPPNHLWISWMTGSWHFVTFENMGRRVTRLTESTILKGICRPRSSETTTTFLLTGYIGK
jgi:hypothetical protein